MKPKKKKRYNPFSWLFPEKKKKDYYFNIQGDNRWLGQILNGNTI